MSYGREALQEMQINEMLQEQRNTMSQTVTGLIEQVTSKTFPNKKGGMSTAYNVVIAGQRYGYGFSPVPFPEGTAVTGVIEKNGQHLNIKDLVLASGDAPATPPPAPQQKSTSYAKPPSKSKDEMTKGDWAKKDLNIARQNACRQANMMFQNLVASGAEVEITSEAVIEEAKKFIAYYYSEE